MIPSPDEEQIDEFGNPLPPAAAPPGAFVDRFVPPAPPQEPPVFRADGGGGVPPADPNALPLPMSLLPPEQSKTVTKNEWSRKNKAPGAEKAQKQYDEAIDKEIGAINERSEADKRLSHAEAAADLKAADEQAAIAKMKEQKLRELAEQRNKAEETWNTRIEASQKEQAAKYAATKAGYYDDKPWYRRVVDALLVGSSVADAYTLGTDPNNTPTQRALDASIAQFRRQKLDDYIHSKEFLEETRKGKDSALKALDYKRDVEIPLEASSALEVSAAETAQLKATTKFIDPGKIDAAANEQIAKAEQLRAEARGKFEQRYETDVSGGSTRTEVDKPPTAGKVTDAQRKAASQAEESMSAIDRLADLPDLKDDWLKQYKADQNLVTAADANIKKGGYITPFVTNWLQQSDVIPYSAIQNLPDEAQAAINTWAEQFAMAVKEISGATVPTEEVARLAPIYFPQVGEGKKTRQQRLLNRLDRVAALAHQVAPDQAEVIRANIAKKREEIKQRFKEDEAAEKVIKIGNKEVRRRAK